MDIYKEWVLVIHWDSNSHLDKELVDLCCQGNKSLQGTIVPKMNRPDNRLLVYKVFLER